MKKVLLLSIVMLIANAVVAQEGLVGHWTFDDPNNLKKAETGNDLILFGNHTAVTGPETGNGAVNIGIGSYYICPHGISANGGGDMVNDFTIVMDIKIPQPGRWYCLYQTTPTNSNDGDWFINPSGQIGVGATGYTEALIKPNEWYRLAISVKNGTRYDYYFDGQRALQGNPGSIDGRFALGTTVLFFADNNQEDNPLNVADIKIFSRSLSNDEIKNLGGYGHVIEGEAPTPLYTYLQTPTPTSIYVCWHENSSMESIVEYGTTEALGKTQTGEAHKFFDSRIWHWVKLIDLEPETVYYYRVITDTVVSDIKRFKSQPRNNQNSGHVRFAVLGDNRTEPPVFSWVIENLRNKVIELYGGNIEDNLNVLLDVGDIVTNGNNLPEYAREYFTPLSLISGNIPIMVSIGNHEREADHYYHYMKYEDIGGTEGEKYYSFRINRVLFVAINSNWQLRNDTQIQWLDGLLNAAQNDDSIDWIFAFCHHPGHSEIWPDGNTAYVQERVIPILNKYSKVDMLMYGHSHNYERGAMQNGNLRLMLNGGAGSALDRWRMYANQQDYPEIQKAYDHYCYTIFDIDIAAKKYTATSFSLGHPDKYLDNEVIDQFVRDKSGTAAPGQPTLSKPQNGSALDAPITLEASSFSGSYPIMSSHFQITTRQGDYSSPVIDLIRDFENIYWDTGAPDYLPIDLNEGIDLTTLTLNETEVQVDSTYWWRVRYRDRNLQWSDWSEEASFTVGTSSKVEDTKTGMIRENKLYPNYPNPFNPTTNIKFDLANKRHVELRIFNVNGRIVRTLVNSTLPAGEHSVTWNGRDEQGNSVPSGTYFYKINCNEFSDIQKAVLIK